MRDKNVACLYNAYNMLSHANGWTIMKKRKRFERETKAACAFRHAPLEMNRYNETELETQVFH